jgi:hypothetical protein
MEWVDKIYKCSSVSFRDIDSYVLEGVTEDDHREKLSNNSLKWSRSG